MFLGVTKLDACWGVCPTTMKAFMDETGEWIRTGPNVIANRSRYIINDFTTEPGYAERPYVVGYPYMRSYLEVPLVSPLGYLLGSYCVVHNDLKEYDNDATVDIMNEIASAIMAHLELRRNQQSRSRSEQLIHSLGGLINDEPAAQQPSENEAGAPTSQTDVLSHPSTREENTEPGMWYKSNGPDWDDASPGMYSRPRLNHTATSLESSDATSPPAEQGFSKTPPTTPPSELEEDPFARAALQRDTVAAATVPEGPATSGSHMTEVYTNGFISSANIKSTLFRAAATIRRSMNMDGFMFLDAVPSSFADRSDQLASDRHIHDSREGVVGPFCATIVQASASQSGERQPRPFQARLPEAALQRFIRRFPQGHVFSADEFGPIDEIFAPGKPFPVDQRISEDNISLRNDVSTLFRFLPTAKYIVFRPLWHFQQECWYAAALGWVSDPTRAIDPSDINLVAAFGNSVMVEVSRLEAMATSRAKSDFVSSISHELRSPLHGIMAGSELLREGVSDNPALLSTLDMLDSCSTTLLDIFNNLLEHAIVTSSGGRYRTTTAHLSVTDLGSLVEDIMDVVYTSHLSENAFESLDHQKGSFALGPTDQGTPQRHRPLLVTLSIGRTASWNLAVDTGAWKRIVMNIFGNALKYTKSGRIQVNLKEVQRTNRSGTLRKYIVFSVEDTGRGMSSDYLKYKLFTPFSQENTHSPGMGLGLSIVQQLARGLGGTVDVKSSVGVGTLVEVLVPAEQDYQDVPSPTSAVDHDRPLYEEHARLLGGRTLCFITSSAYLAMANPGFELSDSMRKRSAAVEQALRANAGVTLGMNVTVGTVEFPIPLADVYVLDSDVLDKATNLAGGSVIPSPYPQATPLVLLCAGAGPPSCSIQEDRKRHIFHLHHPLGPRKLASALCSAMEVGLQSEVQPSAVPDITRLRVSAIDSPSIPSHREDPEIAAKQKPQQPFQSIPPSTSSDDAAATSNTAHRVSYHLLLVDDNAINVKLLAAVMGKLKHSFSTACHGLEAVQLYKESLSRGRSFDMIFMDISMPVMDGFEATREIRELELQERARRCKIVALTGLSSEESRDEALSSGADVFLTKPVKLDMVRRIMTEEFDESR